MMTLLVTGASGFIGNAVLRALGQSPFKVHAVCSHRKPEIDDSITWHQTNLLDPEKVSQLFSDIKPEYLIQLAWCTGQGSYWSDPANLDWISANLVIAKNFAKNGGSRCLFAGTSAEYDWKGNEPLNELTTPLNPLLLYGGSKLASYWALTRYFEQVNISFTWTRFFNPFGEGEDYRRLIPKTCMRLLNGEDLSFDAALSLRDFLHVSDVGEAVVSLIKSNITGPVNIGSGEALSVQQVITTIAENYNRSNQVKFARPETAAGIPDSVVANTHRLNIECGWQPEKAFRERINETCKWWKNQHKKLINEK